MNNQKKYIRCAMVIAALFLVYEQALVLSFTSIMKIANSSTMLHYGAILVFLISAGLIAVSIFQYRKIYRNVAIAMCVAIVLPALYVITIIGYQNVPTIWNSYLLTLGSYVVPAIMFGAILSQMYFFEEPCNLVVFLIVSFITISMTVAVFTTDLSISVIYLNDNGVNYQTISYYSAFACSLDMYLLAHLQKGTWLRKVSFLCYIYLILDLLCVLAAGGRGAVVLLVVVSLYYCCYKIKDKLTRNKILRYSLIVILGVLIFRQLLTIPMLEKGLTRVFTFFSSTSNLLQDQRNIRYALAMDSFLESPFLGHGIGSVFMEIGFYSHNVFLDLLVEGGAILLVVFIGLLLRCLKKFIILRRQDRRMDLIAMFFLDSFINLMFSNYYLSSAGLAFSITYMLCVRCKK